MTNTTSKDRHVQPLTAEVVHGELLPAERPKRFRMTKDLRTALQSLAENNAWKVQLWLDRVATDDPAEAMRLWLGLLKYVTPVLAAAAIADITPKRPREQLATFSEQELLAIIHSSQPAVPALSKPDPDDEELLR
jgi:hypothetical protein